MELKRTYFAVCFLLLVLGCTNAKSQQPKDSTMPDFKFYKVEDGSAFTKSNIEPGKKCMVILFDTSCSHCQDGVDALGKRYHDFKDLNFYLVSFDEKPAIEKFMKIFGKELSGKKNVTVLQDKDHEFIAKFQPTKYPAMYIYSEKQNLVKYFGGENSIDDIVAAAAK